MPRLMRNIFALSAVSVAILGLAATSSAQVSSTPSHNAPNDDGFIVTSATTPDSALAKGQRRHRHDGDDDPFSVASRNRLPWFVTVGPYFGDKSVTFYDDQGNQYSDSPQVGFEAAVGYRYAFDHGEVRVVSRASVYNVDVTGGSSFTTTVSDAEITALFREKNFYIGPGLDIETANVSDGFYSITSDTFVAVSGTVGFDFTPRLFAEIHWHESGTPALSGGSISVGYRF